MRDKDAGSQAEDSPEVELSAEMEEAQHSRAEQLQSEIEHLKRKISRMGQDIEQLRGTDPDAENDLELEWRSSREPVILWNWGKHKLPLVVDGKYCKLHTETMLIMLL